MTMTKFSRINKQREEITMRVLEDMEKGGNEWKKPWVEASPLPPHNPVSGTQYSGRNFLYTYVYGMMRGYADPRWATEKQIKEDCVCVEDLDMRGMSRSLKLGKSTMDNGFGMFRALLGYKLEDRGKRLVTVGRLFPSSQLCHECGYRFSGTKDLSVREWTCPLCGRTHDRDVNAARNIRDEGMRLALSA